MTNTIKVGDVVKCLDFPGDDTCFRVGKVTAVSQDGMLSLTGIVISWESKVWLSDEKFSCMLEGYHMLDETFPGRVTVIA